MTCIFLSVPVKEESEVSRIGEKMIDVAQIVSKVDVVRIEKSIREPMLTVEEEAMIAFLCKVE